MENCMVEVQRSLQGVHGDYINGGKKIMMLKTGIWFDEEKFEEKISYHNYICVKLQFVSGIYSQLGFGLLEFRDISRLLYQPEIYVFDKMHKDNEKLLQVSNDYKLQAMNLLQKPGSYNELLLTIEDFNAFIILRSNKRLYTKLNELTELYEFDSKRIVIIKSFTVEVLKKKYSKKIQSK